MSRETVGPNSGEGPVYTQKLLSQWGFEKEISFLEGVEQAYKKRMGLARHLTIRAVAEITTDDLLDELEDKFPEVEGEARLKVFGDLINPPAIRQEYKGGSTPKVNKGDLWPLLVFPKKKRSTEQMAMKNFKIGQARFDTFLPDQIVDNLPGTQGEALREAKNFLIVPPLGILSYWFESSSWGNKRISIGGWMYHLVVQTVRRESRTKTPSFSLVEKIRNDRWWDPQSQALLKITDKENNLSPVIAHLSQAREMANPLDGGIPGQGSGI